MHHFVLSIRQASNFECFPDRVWVGGTLGAVGVNFQRGLSLLVMFVQMFFNTVEFGRSSVLVILQVDRSLNLLCLPDSVDHPLQYSELRLLLRLEPSVLCYNLGRVTNNLSDVFLHRVRQF